MTNGERNIIKELGALLSTVFAEKVDSVENALEDMAAVPKDT